MRPRPGSRRGGVGFGEGGIGLELRNGGEPFIKKVPMAANDELNERDPYRKTPLFDRFLSFDVEAVIS